MAENNDENEAVAVTGRPNDIPINDPQPAPQGGNTTFADRAKANKATTKQVAAEDDTENKSVSRASTKTRKSTK